MTHFPVHILISMVLADLTIGSNLLHVKCMNQFQVNCLLCFAVQWQWFCYQIHLVMLPTLKNDNSTGNFWLCCLFHMLWVIYVYMYKSMFINNYVCTDDKTIGMCQCEWLAAIEMACYWLIVYCGVHLCRYCIITEGFVSLFNLLLYHYIPLIIWTIFGNFSCKLDKIPLYKSQKCPLTYHQFILLVSGLE